MNQYIQRTKLHEDVSDLIVERIRTQAWGANSKLPSEPEMAEYFGVSRTTVREAVKMLEKAGVLYAKVGSGTFVSENAPRILESRELAMVLKEPQKVSELVSARFVLEPQLAAMAARNATKEQNEALAEILHIMEEKHDRHHLMSYGYRFHQLVAQASGNQVLYGFYMSIAAQLRGLRVIDTLTLETFQKGIADHYAIAQAINDGNAALAKELMRAHLKKDYGVYLTGTE